MLPKARKREFVDLGELRVVEEESRQIFKYTGGVQRVWRLNGDATLDQVFQIAKIPKPLDLNFFFTRIVDRTDRRDGKGDQQNNGQRCNEVDSKQFDRR